MTVNERLPLALAAIKQATGKDADKWVVGGSAGLMLRGLSLYAEPRDLDIYCDIEDVQAIYEALKDYAVDEPVVSSTSMYQSTLCHFLIHDVQVELVGGFQVYASGCCYETKVRELLIPYGAHIPIDHQSLTVSVVPLAHELWFNWLREREDRVTLIAHAFAQAPKLHEEALLAIESCNTFTEEARSSIRRNIEAQEAEYEL